MGSIASTSVVLLSQVPPSLLVLVLTALPLLQILKFKALTSRQVVLLPTKSVLAVVSAAQPFLVVPPTTPSILRAQVYRALASLPVLVTTKSPSLTVTTSRMHQSLVVLEMIQSSSPAPSPVPLTSPATPTSSVLTRRDTLFTALAGTGSLNGLLLQLTALMALLPASLGLLATPRSPSVLPMQVRTS